MDVKVNLNKKEYLVTTAHQLPSQVAVHLRCNDHTYQALWNPSLQSVFVTEANNSKPMLSRVFTIKHRHINTDDNQSSKEVSFDTKTNTNYQSQLSLDGLSYQKTAKQTQSSSQSYRSPIAGKVLKIFTTAQCVQKNDPILIIESMKMENNIVSPMTGIISKLSVKEGESIKAGDVLFVIHHR